MPLLSEITTFFERFAPRSLAEDWDNVGLLVGDRQRPVQGVLTCLTLTPDVAQEAISRQAQLIVAHHPIMFRAIKQITSDTSEGRMLLDLIAAGVAVYSPHTSYDSAKTGINQQLAELLDLTDVEPLRRFRDRPDFKIVCFVPQSHLTAVQEAIWAVGAGTIGEYVRCSFVVDGVGTFHGSANSRPAIGQAQQFESVAEARVEILCPQRLLPAALRSLKSAHPYEEPACDVYPLEPRESTLGSGRMGVWNPHGTTAPASLSDFLALTKSRLGLPVLPFVGDPARPVQRVAIACGAGGEFLSTAIQRGCDVLLTGEARFHAALEARTAGIGLVLAGHYATERPAMERMASLLAGEFPDLRVWASELERDPIQWS
ncbi:MAG: Nif3-like dinuclear metal center hexameric protein [Planctomycetes bacterium]|nr:Nif3-like dinuclear metal center hexameric protein [Planctomycetota bacterium]